MLSRRCINACLKPSILVSMHNLSQERKRIVLERAHVMDDERPNCTIPEQHEVRASAIEAD